MANGNEMVMNVNVKKEVPVTLQSLGFKVKEYTDRNGKVAPMVFKWENPQTSMLGAVYLEAGAQIGDDWLTTIDTLRIPIVKSKFGNAAFVGGISYLDRNNERRDHVRINRDFAKIILSIWTMSTMAADAQDKSNDTK